MLHNLHEAEIAALKDRASGLEERMAGVQHALQEANKVRKNVVQCCLEFI